MSHTLISTRSSAANNNVVVFKIIIYTILLTAKYSGSCKAAGYKKCCTATALESCLGKPPSCYCDKSCHLLKDCCNDAHKIGCPRGVEMNIAIIKIINIISCL